MYRKILSTLFLLIPLAVIGCANYKVNIVGVSLDKFKDRSWKIIALGVASSFLVHEASHLMFAEMNGGSHYDYDEYVVIMENYYNESYRTQQMFHRAGFVGQLLVGGILTAVPKTRHHDFTLGFNGFTMINTALYTITGGLDRKYSDIRQLNNGELEGSIYTLGAGILTYYNLKGETK